MVGWGMGGTFANGAGGGRAGQAGAGTKRCTANARAQQGAPGTHRRRSGQPPRCRSRCRCRGRCLRVQPVSQGSLTRPQWQTPTAHAATNNLPSISRIQTHDLLASRTAQQPRGSPWSRKAGLQGSPLLPPPPSSPPPPASLPPLAAPGLLLAPLPVVPGASCLSSTPLPLPVAARRQVGQHSCLQRQRWAIGAAAEA